MMGKPVKKVSISNRAAAIKKKQPLETKKVVRLVSSPVKPIATPAARPVASTQKKLMDNFVSLQKVLINLSVKLDNLANQISKLVELFEISAKSLAKKDFDFTGGKEINNKLDSLIEQNKLIARGLTMMHDRVEGLPPQPRPQLPQRRPIQRPTPRQQQPLPGQPMQAAKPEIPQVPPEGYEKSLSFESPQKEFKKLGEGSDKI